MNEFVFVDIHLAEVPVQIVQVLTIHILLSTSNGRNNHIREIWACTGLFGRWDVDADVRVPTSGDLEKKWFLPFGVKTVSLADGSADAADSVGR